MNNSERAYPHQAYVDLIVDGDGSEEYPGYPPLSEELARRHGLPLDRGFAPPEAEETTRALGNQTRDTRERRAS